MTFDELIQSAPEAIQTRLNDLKGMRERPDYHPEPNAFEHVRIVTERLLQTDNINLILAGVLHDICKVDCARTNPKTGWPTSPGHEDAAFELMHNDESIESWIESFEGSDFIKISLIVLNHMRFHQIGEMRKFKRDTLIQSWIAVDIWEDLKIFGAADNMLVDFDLNNLPQSWKSYELPY